jgi:thiol-disulfide isomerase/thioredoxin
MGMIGVGPLALPILPLLLAATLIAALFASRRAEAGQRARVESILYRIMLSGVLAARLAFIVRYWDVYRPAPLGLLDLRDGGFFVWAGVAAGAGTGIWYLWRERALRQVLLWSLLAGGAAGAIGSIVARIAQPPRTGMALPGAAFSVLGGGQMRLDALAGKPVVINLWASWCPPCRREMPALQQAQADNRDIVFVFANQGEDADTIRRYLATEHVDIANIILDRERDIARQAGAPALPTTLFFDRRGKLLHIRMGQLSAASLARQLDAARRGEAE